MSDPIPMSAPPAAPEAPAAPASSPAAPAASPSAPQAAPVETPPAVHPAWDRALNGIPDAWQAPIRAEIANMEREHQKALEQARSGSVDPQWRDLIEEAREAGLTPDELAEAYSGQEDMRARLLDDPDGFLQDISAFIDAQVAAGTLTRREGTAMKGQAQSAAAAAGADPDLFETPEAKEISELKQRLDRQEQERLAEQQRREEERVSQEAAAYADQFMGDLDAVFREAGFRDATTGADVMPPELQRQIAYVADAILDAEPNLSPRDAVTKAVQSFQQATAQWQPGQQAAAAPAPRGMPPVIGGGTTAAPAPQQQVPAAQGDRNAAAVQAMKQLLGQ